MGERNARGSASVESIFAIVFMMLVALGVVQVAFTLYARNVLASAAHEGARAAVERGTPPAEAEGIALATIERAAGGLLEGLRVVSVIETNGGRQMIRVRITGSLRPFGIVPVRISFDETASASRPVAAR
jgi:hypothetical protein